MHVIFLSGIVKKIRQTQSVTKPSVNTNVHAQNPNSNGIDSFSEGKKQLFFAIKNTYIYIIST